MKVVAHEKIWSVPHPRATLNSDARFLLGCERCASTCCTADPCRCCRAYKTRTGGGTTTYLPDDGKGHMQIMTMRELRATYACEVEV